MPADDEPPLSPKDKETIGTWVRGDFTEVQAARQLREGRSKVRRLSRKEYANTIQDLFGIRPSTVAVIRPDINLNLPDDGRVDGYDKVSAALPLAAEGAMGYYTMADDLLKKFVLQPVLKTPPDKAGRTTRSKAVESGESPGHSLVLDDGTIVSFNTDTSSGRLAYPGSRVPGVHKVRVSVYAYQTDKPLAFGIYVGHTVAYPQLLELVKVLEAPPGKAAVLETEIYLRTDDTTGVSTLSLIPFGLGVQVPKNTFAKDARARAWPSSGWRSRSRRCRCWATAG